MIQILLHLWGDYLTQSDWMAQNKTKGWFPAAAHAFVYSLPFMFLCYHIGDCQFPCIAVYRTHWLAWFTIFGSHFLIDRYRLARYVVWAKNFLAPKRLLPSMPDPMSDLSYPPLTARNFPWEQCSASGYAANLQPWLAFWLLIIADNTLHLTINYLALRYL